MATPRWPWISKGTTSHRDGSKGPSGNGVNAPWEGVAIDASSVSDISQYFIIIHLACLPPCFSCVRGVRGFGRSRYALGPEPVFSSRLSRFIGAPEIDRPFQDLELIRSIIRLNHFSWIVKDTSNDRILSRDWVSLFFFL